MQLAKKSKNSFVKINPTLDKEHTRMLKAVDKLYDECYKHWETEENMYKEGLQQMPAGHQTLTWNTRNFFGQPVSAGIYFYQIQASGFIKTRKMVLLK